MEPPLAIEPSLRGVPRAEDFLRTIIADPLDDTPRLVFADWLSDHGLEERAELIRLQCRMYQLEEAGLESREEYKELDRRVDDLLGRYAAEWKPGPELANCLFRRGLLETYRIDGGLWKILEIASHICRETTVQVLRIRTMGDFRQLLVLPGLKCVYELELTSCGGSDAIRALVRSPSLRNLRIVKLCNSLFSDEQFEILMQAPWLEELIRLEIPGHGLGLLGVREVVTAVSPRLRWLDLGGRSLSSPLAGILAESPRLKGLKTLILDGCLLGPEGAWTLAGSLPLGGIERLSLSANHIRNLGVLALLESPYLTHISWLDLDANQLTDTGIEALAESSLCRSLQYLSLERNQIGDAGALALLRSPLADRPVQVFLGRNRLSNAVKRQVEDCWPCNS